MVAYVASVLVAFVPHHHACATTYTVPMAKRAAVTAYAGTRTVTTKDGRHLARFLRCQRNPAARGFVRWFYARQRRLHNQRVVAAQTQVAMASWYDAAGGPIACGGDSYAMGVASRTLPCGTRLQVCLRRCVNAVVFDRGPAAWTHRDMDLSRQVADAIGFGGLGPVRWRLL